MKNKLAVSISCKTFALALCLLLAACASQPDGSHSFTVTPDGAEPGVWKLGDLAGSGRIELTMRLRGDSDKAAAASFEFNYTDEFHPNTNLAFDDRACRGAHTLSLSHNRSRERLTDYFDTRIPWEQTARLRIEWRSDGRLAVTVNGREQKIMETNERVRAIAMVVKFGEVLVDDLTYTKLTADSPLLPPESY